MHNCYSNRVYICTVTVTLQIIILLISQFGSLFSLSSSSEKNSGFSLLPHILTPPLQTNTPTRTIQHRNTPTWTNQQIANGSMMPTMPMEMLFVGQRKWIGGSVVEISVSRSIGSVDRCLWNRSVLVEEIIIFFSPSSYSSPLTSSHNKTIKSLLPQPQPLSLRNLGVTSVILKSLFREKSSS